MLLELLQYFLIKRHYKNYVNPNNVRSLQELCIVCKGYVENQNKRTLLTYSFVIDTIKYKMI